MKKEILVIPIILVMLLALSFSKPQIAILGEGLAHGGMVCVQVNNGPVECSNNLYTNMGKNITRDRLGFAVGAPINYIAVGNGSAATATSTSLPSEITECGLTRAQGTASIVGTSIGNVSVEKTFTLTCTVPTVNTTGLYNGTGNFLWAYDSFTATGQLNSGDTLKITWYYWTA